MQNNTRWRRDFPVSCDDDTYATRRELMKFLGLTSIAFLAGTCAAPARRWWGQFSTAQSGSIAIAGLEEIPVGGHKLFRRPAEDDPCILLRLESERFVAFEQRCTHLSCPVYFNAADNQLVCPCHHGFFSADDGRPIAGPPKRGLTRLPISVQGAQVWVRFAKGERA